MGIQITTGVQYSGIWTMQQANAAISAGTWPTQPMPALYGWGRNNAQFPALGLNNTTDYSSPKQTGSGTKDWATVSAGTGFTIAIKNNGQLWAWGYNVVGALGNGGVGAYVSSPVQVGALTNWLSVTSGYQFNLAIKTDGTLWSWGINTYGQLGDGTITTRSSPIQIGSGTNWSKTACGYYHSLAIKTDGTLWAWGNNSFGALGTNNTTYYSSPAQVGASTNWLDVVCGYQFTIAVRTTGTIWGWGFNSSYGNLGLGNLTNYSTAKQIGALTTWSKSGVASLAAYGIKTDGTLWSWGRNSNGQLGLSDLSNRSSPNQVGTLTNWSKLGSNGCAGPFVTAIKTDGTLWAWGQNLYGQLGNGSTAIGVSSPVQVGALTTWSLSSDGNSHTMGIAIT